MKRLFAFLLFVFITHPVIAEFICDEIGYYFAVYNANTYTCNSGYYLPANTTGSVQCPNGFSCPGGTFAFNPNSFQGINFGTVTNNTLNNMCADNFPPELFATYESNIITISWDDGDNDPTNNPTSTCTYDGAINTPTTIPTKRGHIFNGWRFTGQ